MKDAVQDETARRSKKPYKTPEVVAYGSVAELTSGGGSPFPDTGGHQSTFLGGG